MSRVRCVFLCRIVVTEKVQLRNRLFGLPPRKRRTDINAGAEKENAEESPRSLASSHESMRESFPLLSRFLSFRPWQIRANQIIRHLVLSLAESARYKSYGEFPGSWYIYTICRDRNEPATDYALSRVPPSRGPCRWIPRVYIIFSSGFCRRGLLRLI